MALLLELKKGKYAHPSGRKNSLNDMTGSEWAQSSKSIMEYTDKRSEKQRTHGASFPQSLAAHQIAIYTKKGETVLDPFLGVGTTLDACAELGRKGIGIELNKEFVDLSKKDLLGKKQKVIHGDTTQLHRYVKPESVDFIITSPPYANLLKKVQKKFRYKWQKFGFTSVDNTKPYSVDPKDIGNMSYEKSLISLEKVMKETYTVLKNNCYVAWIVKDFRDIKSGKPIVNFHNDVVKVAENTNWIHWDTRIYDQTRFRALVILGIPSRNFYLNIGHSYILIFKKDENYKK